MQCKKLSRASRQHFKVGSILVKGNRILSYGVNSSKTHPMARGPFNALHAEHQAICNALIAQTRGATLYVYRETRDGNSANSKPCLRCTELLKLAGVKDVYFSSKEWPYYGTMSL